MGQIAILIPGILLGILLASGCGLAPDPGASASPADAPGRDGVTTVEPKTQSAARLEAIPASAATTAHTSNNPSMSEFIEKTDDEWRRSLTAEQFRVLRGHGTERAFTGAYWDTKDAGKYRCAGCDLELFRSEHKFDSGTGWPSYWQPALPENVGIREDRTLFMRRTEVHCRRCGGHLGHVFDDGPPPTGLRYCINSAALKFEKAVPGAP